MKRPRKRHSAEHTMRKRRGADPRLKAGKDLAIALQKLKANSRLYPCSTGENHLN